jgi:polysaccharide deacetylase 2 family uncharacterized protein YibQ
MIKRTGLLWPVLFCTLFFFGAAFADEPGPATPAISIIIDDMGKRLGSGRRVAALSGPVACSFLPQAPYTPMLADTVHANGKEVMLHLPMDSMDRRNLDPGAVTLDMTERQFISTVATNLASVPHVSGGSAGRRLRPGEGGTHREERAGAPAGRDNAAPGNRRV